MDIPFFSKHRKQHATARSFAVFGSGPDPDPAMLGELLSECDLLRERASGEGVELDSSVDSLSALDQLVPSWREGDPEIQSRLGNDAGLYLGSVIVRSVPGANWQVWPNGHPVVRLTTGREIDTVALGHGWAESGTPELSQVFAEASED